MSCSPMAERARDNLHVLCSSYNNTLSDPPPPPLLPVSFFFGPIQPARIEKPDRPSSNRPIHLYVETDLGTP